MGQIVFAQQELEPAVDPPGGGCQSCWSRLLLGADLLNVVSLALEVSFEPPVSENRVGPGIRLLPEQVGQAVTNRDYVLDA
jgi:hypothetical protein